MGYESVVQKEKKRDSEPVSAQPVSGKARPRFATCILDYTRAAAGPESLEEFGRRLGYAPQAAGIVQRSEPMASVVQRNESTAGIVQRQVYPYQIERENILYNRLKEINGYRLDSVTLGLLCEAVRADLGASITIKDAAAEQEFETYIGQIINTCRVYRELLHVKYPPAKYRIQSAGEQGGQIEKTDESEKKTIQQFIRDNINFGENSYFHPDLCEKYEKVIADHIRKDLYYRKAGRPEYKEAEYSLSREEGHNPPKIAPVDGEKAYCVYRSMGQAEYERLQAYFPEKDRIEQAILDNGKKYHSELRINGRNDAQTIVAYTSSSQADIERDRIRTLCSRVPNLTAAGSSDILSPVANHMGNLEQALSYGGILVKFYIKSDRAALLTKDYLADEGVVSGGSQGRTTQNKIGTKQERRGGDFSFNLGDNLWASLLFLSTVEKYEGFDLRKSEGGATAPGSRPLVL